MEFIKNIQKSVYSPAYYQELLTKPFLYSLKYYVLFVLCLAVLGSVATCFATFPAITGFIRHITPNIVNYYPEELKLKVDHGKVSTNVQEPYFIKMPEDLKSVKDLSINHAPAGTFTNLVVIDTQNNFSLERFSNYNTAFLITKDSFISYGKNNSLSIQPLGPEANFTLDRGTISYWVNKLAPFLYLAYPAFFLGMVFLFFLILIVKLLYLLFAALLIWLIATVRKIPLSYGKSYQLGLHLMTLGILLEGVMFLVHMVTQFKLIPFFFTVVLIIMMLVNVKKAKEMVIQNDNSLNSL